MVARYGTKYGKPLFSVCAEPLRTLESYPWPGNIRQLENVIQQAVLTSTGSELKFHHLSPTITLRGESSPPVSSPREDSQALSNRHAKRASRQYHSRPRKGGRQSDAGRGIARRQPRDALQEDEEIRPLLGTRGACSIPPGWSSLFWRRPGREALIGSENPAVFCRKRKRQPTKTTFSRLVSCRSTFQPPNWVLLFPPASPARFAA